MCFLRGGSSILILNFWCRGTRTPSALDPGEKKGGVERESEEKGRGESSPAERSTLMPKKAPRREQRDSRSIAPDPHGAPC